MPLRRLPDLFYLLVIDEDKREFTVEGPMQDDTAWNAGVCRAQQEGRHVRCFSMRRASPAAVTAEWKRTNNHMLVACNSDIGIALMYHEACMKESFD
jgi:hypothetical protein